MNVYINYVYIKVLHLNRVYEGIDSNKTCAS